ncbi:hypothetical protein [Streptomyces natalensis]|uniref:Integral membrane protein n=1 Tax=Streptomyces natalensis ATCC 27448 TaxID=1240678 RepID=A0A0D7CVT0_9ACTN|nr:hypothetical protein [Streptomyces natalensis]KIZ19487.1 integral membrane protein [Streptomyces natalensis ATCC 27448]
MSASAPVRLRGRVTEAARLPEPPRRRPGRALGACALLLIGTLLLPLSLATVWARSELTDTDRYVATVAPLAANRAVQDAIVHDVTNGVMTHIRLDGLLRAIPRAERAALLKRFTRGLREFVGKQVRQVVTGRSFPAVWTGVHRTAHQALDDSLTASGDAPVTLDLTPIVDRVRHQLAGNGLGIDIAHHIPRMGAEVVLLRSPDVPRARLAYRAVRTAAPLLPSAAALCLLAGLLLARRRRRALICAGTGCAATAALLAVALALVRTRALEGLPSVIPRAAASAYADTLTGSLRQGVWLVIGAALVTTVTAAAGPPAVRVARRLSAAFGTRPRST